MTATFPQLTFYVYKRLQNCLQHFFSKKIFFFNLLILDSTLAASDAKLEIFPTQEVQRKPVGKSLILTCRPNVPQGSLVTDLQWKDNMNNTILPKP